MQKFETYKLVMIEPLSFGTTIMNLECYKRTEANLIDSQSLKY